MCNKFPESLKKMAETPIENAHRSLKLKRLSNIWKHPSYA
jgi:hypothetical protein